MHNFISNLFNCQQDIPILLADGILDLIGPLAVGLIYAFTAWVKKQKDKQRTDDLDSSIRSNTPPKTNNTPEESGGWMEKIEKLVEQSEQERINYENEFDTPSLQGEFYDSLPPVLGDQIEINNSNAEPDLVSRDEKIDEQSNIIINQSPIYKSPIYHSNIARDITRDINIARQGFVSAIILNPPRSLEDPDKITRY